MAQCSIEFGDWLSMLSMQVPASSARLEAPLCNWSTAGCSLDLALSGLLSVDLHGLQILPRLSSTLPLHPLQVLAIALISAHLQYFISNIVSLRYSERAAEVRLRLQFRARFLHFLCDLARLGTLPWRYHFSGCLLSWSQGQSSRARYRDRPFIAKQTPLGIFTLFLQS